MRDVDFNLDGVVDFGDFLELASVYGERVGSFYTNHPIDLDGDGIAGFVEFLYLAELWGGTWDVGDLSVEAVGFRDTVRIGEQFEFYFAAGCSNFGPLDTFDVELAGDTQDLAMIFDGRPGNRIVEGREPLGTRRLIYNVSGCGQAVQDTVRYVVAAQDSVR